ncbi:zinc-dependent alcohol dehydrogenase [Paenibacillus monticola]|uniref:Alcohol dehydrogenase catalytic domain-containing protein n=1 Tax=Paenibacillus monticola TaxID=2666075 RepID=A0A7X2L0Z2_9BACL|nr:alcohol dehydrogenase catalytic domain-containing protein [Paenibacillus monticola]MRN52643.1 alcohol dehydrogenase catalytic domain-containing protein [Paenibacillus monticola]
MKAYVWKETGRIEKEIHWSTPEYGSHEVLIAIKSEGICTTDIHMVSGKLDFAKPPWVLGHEMSGVIVKIGDDVKGWKIGDRVVIDPVVSCGSCKYCLTGKKYLCPDGGELGTNYGSGGYGEFVVAKPSNLYRLPAEMSFAEGAMMEPLNCTLGAIDRVRNMVGSHVAVFGAGPAGLLFIQLARAYGAIKVTLLDIKDEPLALGLRLGADEVVNITKVSLQDYFAEQEIEVVVEASGSEAAIGHCFEFVASSGTVVLYGLNGLHTPTITSDMIVGKDLSIVTCTSAPLLWYKGIRLVQAGKVNVKDIITQQVPFDEAEALLEEIMDGKSSATKTVLSY